MARPWLSTKHIEGLDETHCLSHLILRREGKCPVMESSVRAEITMLPDVPSTSECAHSWVA